MSLAYPLRPAVPADLPAMADLWVRSWRATLPEIDFEARRPWLLAHYDRLVGAGTLCRVALDAAGAPAGFVFIDPATGYLDQLAVDTAHWGHGAAEALMAEAKRLSPVLVALDVNQDNPRAVRFYEKLGLAITHAGRNPTSGRATWHMEWRPA